MDGADHQLWLREAKSINCDTDQPISKSFVIYQKVVLVPLNVLFKTCFCIFIFIFRHKHRHSKLHDSITVIIITWKPPVHTNAAVSWLKTYGFKNKKTRSKRKESDIMLHNKVNWLTLCLPPPFLRPPAVTHHWIFANLMVTYQSEHP